LDTCGPRRRSARRCPRRGQRCSASLRVKWRVGCIEVRAPAVDAVEAHDGVRVADGALLRAREPAAADERHALCDVEAQPAAQVRQSVGLRRRVRQRLFLHPRVVACGNWRGEFSLPVPACLYWSVCGALPVQLDAPRPEITAGGGSLVVVTPKLHTTRRETAWRTAAPVAGARPRRCSSSPISWTA